MEMLLLLPVLLLLFIANKKEKRYTHPVPTTYTHVHKSQISTADKDIATQVDIYGGTTCDYIYPEKPKELKWFISEWASKLSPSIAEQKIIDELCKYDIEWYREVSFEGLQTSSWGWARFDFWLPQHRTIIEYHGAAYHATEDRLSVDQMKTQFCKTNKINLIVWDRSDYYHIPKRVQQLLPSLAVDSKVS